MIKIREIITKKKTPQNAHVTHSDLALLGSNLLVILVGKWRLGEDSWTVQGHTIQW